MRVLRWAGRLWTAVLIVTVLLAVLLGGLRLLLPIFGSPPALVAAVPPDGAAGVSPRANVTLTFSGSMNPRSVERALQISPVLRWTPIWNADRTTLTISPTETLRPDTSYVLSLGAGALSQGFRPLAQPVDLRFRTAPAPAVVQVLPADAADVPLDTPISVTFSRTIVPVTTVMRPAALPEIHFEPPISGSAIWLDQVTVLFRPAEPLRPGTRYRATIDAALADVTGAQLNMPFSWSFSTPAPAVLSTAPADGARLVAPRATLALTVSQPLDLASVRATLSISPTADGALAATNLPDGKQLITYTPAAGWQPNTTYVATLRAGAMPIGGNLPLIRPARWRFTTAPQPALTGRFPGEGQTLPPREEIRLVFNTPMDDATFRAGLRLTPPATVRSVTAGDAEVRVAADLQAATVYTMTLPASLPDRNGIPLGQEYQIRFLTASAGPALALPEAPDHLAQVLPGQPAGLLVRRTNLSALSFDLYRLDETTVVRMLGFQESDWSGFQPERYGQPLLRSWRVPLADPLNTSVEQRVPLSGPPGDSLAAGAYYLHLSTLEGPRGDLLLMVSRTRLTLQSSDAALLIWATDVISGTPAGGLPLALYQAGALIQQGATGADGLLQLARPANPAGSTYVALAGGALFGAVSSSWSATDSPARPDNQIFVATDRAAYHAGERIHLAGIVRATVAPSGTLMLPQAREIFVSVRLRDASSRIYQEKLKIGSTGVFSTEVPLASDAPLGSYEVATTIDGDAGYASFAVEPEASAPLRMTVSAPPAAAAGADVPLAIEVRSPEGLPAASAAISWTLDAERAAFRPASDYSFGDEERAPAEVAARSGAGQTDADGRFGLVITDTVASDVALRYRLTARAAEAGGASASAEGMFLVAPAPVYASVRLPSRIFTAGQEGTVEALAVAPDGRPAPGAALRVEVYRRTWERDQAIGVDGQPQTVWRPRDQLAFTRNGTTGADGTARLPLTLPAGGAYRLHVGPVGQSAYSAATIWATAPGFTAWGDLPGDQPLLIADRPSYRPGETARLLVVAPFAQSTMLLARVGAGGVEGQVQTIRAGELLALTLRPDDPPAVPVSVLLASRAAGASGSATAPPPLPLATTTLAVSDDRQALAVSIATDRAEYAPGATATLTVTTTDARGAGIAADVVLSIAGASAAPQARIADTFLPLAPPLVTAPQLGAQPPAATRATPDDRAPATRAAPLVYWNSALRTSASGVLTLTVDLPQQSGELSAVAWAAAAERAGQGASTLSITRPLELSAETPPAFRAGDEVELTARVANNSPAAQEVEAGLSAAGVQIRGGAALIQRATVAPGASTRFAWPAQVLDATGVRLSVSARVGSAPPENIEIEQPILPRGADTKPRAADFGLLREYLDPQTGQPLDPTQLRVGQLVRARLTVVARAQRGSVTIDEALPAGAALVAADDPGGFERVERAAGSLKLTSPTLKPGIYQYRYLLRIVAPGRYGVPAPAARAADGAAGGGNATTVSAR